MSQLIAGAPRASTRSDEFLGQGLVFLIAPMRSGTTLLRKLLDSHPEIYSPAETWFLLPLLELWHGRGEAGGAGGAGFAPRQAAAALRGHVDRSGFARCCRAFAGAFYRDRLPEGTTYFVDKTPPYLSIAAEIAEVFPAARFLVLARDPRGTLWSRATWKHSSERDPVLYIEGVAADFRCLARFGEAVRHRALVVRYERLCADPGAELASVTSWLDLEYAPSMVSYGDHAHHEGYGDDATRAHTAPHRGSTARWRGGLDAAFQTRLLRACGAETLAALGLDDLEVVPDENAERVILTPAPSDPPPTPSLEGRGLSETTPRARGRAVETVVPPRAGGRRVLLFVHAGSRTRDALGGLGRGLARAGAEVLAWELGATKADATALLEALIRANGIDLAVGLGANALSIVSHGERDGAAMSFFDALETPHLMWWLEAPHWAHGPGFHEHFGTGLLGGPWSFHLVPDEATGAEMAGVLGFRNVIPQSPGVDEDRFRPGSVAPSYDLVFAPSAPAPPPTPIMLRELDADEPDVDAIRRDLAPAVRRRLDELAAGFGAACGSGAGETVGGLLRQVLERRLGEPRRPVLQIVAELAGAGAGLREACGLLLGRPSAYARAGMIVRDLDTWRGPFVASYLSRHARCAVPRGAPLEGWDCRAERVDGADRAGLLAGGRVGLAPADWRVDGGVGLDALEMAASGRAVLCERRPGLESCFDATAEVAAFETPGEARRLVEVLLASPDDREALGEAARVRVEKDHTWTGRAMQVLSLVGQTTKRW